MPIFRNLTFRFLATLFIAFWIDLTPRSVEADFLTYTSRSGFDAAASSSVSVVNFEGFSAANVPSASSLDGISFVYSLGSVSLRVVDSIITTSGTQSLGTDDRDMLADGDNLDFSFTPRSGFGLYVISRDSLINGDIQLTAGGSVASLVASASQINLGAGGLAWFLGIQSNDGSTFTTASLTTHGGGGQFNYNLDDFANVLPVPEPASFGLLAFAASIALHVRARRIAR